MLAAREYSTPRLPADSYLYHYGCVNTHLLLDKIRHLSCSGKRNVDELPIREGP
jgi:hypothetical protein